MIREIDDKIILNRKKEDYPMIRIDEWGGSIYCQIVFINTNNTYLVRNGFGMEFLVSEEEIITYDKKEFAKIIAKEIGKKMDEDKIFDEDIFPHAKIKGKFW